MLIELSPIIMDATLTVTKSGDVLTINGIEYNFSPLPDGATLPAGEVPCAWVFGPIERVDGEIILTLLLPCDYGSPHERIFPESIIDPADGPVAFPGDENDMDS